LAIEYKNSRSHRTKNDETSFHLGVISQAEKKTIKCGIFPWYLIMVYVITNVHNEITPWLHLKQYFGNTDNRSETGRFSRTEI